MMARTELNDFSAWRWCLVTNIHLVYWNAQHLFHAKPAFSPFLWPTRLLVSFTFIVLTTFLGSFADEVAKEDAPNPDSVQKYYLFPPYWGAVLIEPIQCFFSQPLHLRFSHCVWFWFQENPLCSTAYIIWFVAPAPLTVAGGICSDDTSNWCQMTWKIYSVLETH